MEHTKLRFGIIYGEKTFATNELNELRESLKVYGVELLSQETSPYTNACLDLLSPLVLFATDPNFIQTLISNVVSSGGYDAIKLVAKFLYSKFHNRHMTKIQGGKITEETANVQLAIGNNRMVLPVDIDQDKYEYAVDKFFETVKFLEEEKTQEQVYYMYSESGERLIAKTERQIIAEAYERQRRREDDRG